MTPYFEAVLDKLAAKYGAIMERRGSGLMQGLVFDRPVGDVIRMAMDRGLILINAGSSILRFLPPLVVTKEQIDEMYNILDSVLGEVL